MPFWDEGVGDEVVWNDVGYKVMYRDVGNVAN